ncbi:MAG: aldo/keto reductase [Woeseiaceae bacterium]
MQRIKLTNTELNVSRICLGTMTFGAQTDESDAARMIDLCRDNGVNFLDTANMYSAGAAEAFLGRIIGKRRSDFVLASKVGIQVGDRKDTAGLSAHNILAQAEDSLRRLQTDYLDLYYFHAPDTGTPMEESLGAMQRLIDQGKVRYAAASNYASWQACKLAWIAERDKLPATPVSQQMYNLLARGLEQEFVPAAADLGISIVAYNPLAGGLLTGKHDGVHPVPGSRFDGNDHYQNRYWHREYFEAVAALAEIAAEADRSLLSLALTWLLHHTNTACVILGASKVGQLEADLQAAANGPLPDDAIRRIDTIWHNLRGVTPIYNR